MFDKKMLEAIKNDDEKFLSINRKEFCVPTYDPLAHYLEITKSPYFRAIVVLRHYIRKHSDYFFSNDCNAKNIDLFMITPSVSSPMGAGSDSKALPIMVGDISSFLVDSSQFGFEP